MDVGTRRAGAEVGEKQSFFEEVFVHHHHHPIISAGPDVLSATTRHFG